MTIAINLGTLPSLTGPSVTFTLSDNGNAHVLVGLFIPGITPTPILFDESFIGSKSFTLPMPVGNYRCAISVQAFNTATALGPTYDSRVEINGCLAASATGAVASGTPSDVGTATLNITVI